MLEELEGTLLREELVVLEALLADFRGGEFRKRNLETLYLRSCEMMGILSLISILKYQFENNE